MSWNITTRLNNLELKVNTIANTGLTNPLEQQLNANSYNMINLNTLNANSNVLKLQSNNIGGIETNCNVTVGGNLTCDTLNYTSLNPPIQGGGETLQETLVNGNSGGGLDITEINNLELNTLYYINLINGFNPTYTLSQGMTQTGNNITSQGSILASFISNNTYLNPSVSSTINFNDTGGYVKIGLAINDVFWGAFWYGPQTALYIVNNGANGANVPLPVGTVKISVVVLNGKMNIYVNDAIVPSLEISIPSGNYNIFGITNQNVNTIFSNIITTYASNPEPAPTLSEVLASGNSAGNASITDVNELTVDTLNYTTLNPPIVSGGENLQQTLSIGNNAGGLDIVGVNNLQINYGNCQNIQFFSGNTAVLKQGVNNGNLVISNNNFASAGTVFDSLYNGPIPKAIKILNNKQFAITNIPQGSVGNGTIFTLLLDTYYTNKINYAQIFFNSIVMTSSLTSTSLDLYLTDNPNDTFDPESTTYTYQSIDLTNSNNNSFINNTGLSIVFSSSTYFNAIYLCVNSTFALPSLTTTISGEISVGINVPTITADPT